MNLCQQHGNQYITYICIQNHICQKLMCSVCQFSHQEMVSRQNILPIPIYSNLVREKIAQFDLQDQSNVKDTQKIIKREFDDILRQVSELSQKAHNSLDYLFQEILSKDRTYYQLLNQNPLETSFYDLQKISYILNNSILEQWENQKNMIIQTVLKRWFLLQKSIRKVFDILEQQITQEIEEIQTSNDDSPFSIESIKMPLIFGVKHGKTLFIKDGIIEENCLIKLYRNVEIINQQGFISERQKSSQIYKPTQFQVKKLFDNGQIQYMKNGLILKIEQIPNLKEDYAINRNLEQLQHLRWEGKYDAQTQKTGLWVALWQGKKLEVGGEYKNGFKTGQWIELSDFYYNQFQATEKGLYDYGRKTGNWKIQYNGEIIGQGEYDKEIKVGYWIEINQNFNSSNLIFNQGNYIKGKKAELWYTKIKDEIIGQGRYDRLNNLKTGLWKELYTQFQGCCELTFQGNYENGMRVEQWQIQNRNKIIGEGSYGVQGKKDGYWVEPWNYNDQINQQGIYESGQKVGEWKIVKNDQDQSIIGGGFYQNGLKNGKWTELFQKYNDYCQIKYQGIYENGRKSGQWQILYKNQYIGGGDFIDGKKNGRWIETHENFQDFCQIILEGEYEEGKQLGLWQIKFRDQQDQPFFQIGGGDYQYGLKNGSWIDLYKNYEWTNKVTLIGHYQNGQKFGEWRINKNDIQIGGGNYINGEIKDGLWIELDDNFRKTCQVIYKGKYSFGKKIEKWVTQFREENQEVFYDIGGGLYIEGTQQGEWTEIYQNFWSQSQIKFKGIYRNGIKQGSWKIWLQDSQMIGGGVYEEGLKSGPWTEFLENTQNPQSNLRISTYRSGIQIKNP